MFNPTLQKFEHTVVFYKLVFSMVVTPKPFRKMKKFMFWTPTILKKAIYPCKFLKPFHKMVYNAQLSRVLAFAMVKLQKFR
jgi:hypothetical protein